MHPSIHMQAVPGHTASFQSGEHAITHLLSNDETPVEEYTIFDVGPS